jgi:hypothetical protein
VSEAHPELTATLGAPRLPAVRPDVLALVALVLLAFALALQGPNGTLYNLALPAAGIAAGVFLARRTGSAGRGWAGGPPLLVLGYATVVAPVTLANEFLAGAAGLALLLWLAAEPYPRGQWRLAGGTLVLPALAVAVAALASIALPTSQDFLGVAGGLLVAELLFAGWLYTHPADLAEAGAPPRS